MPIKIDYTGKKYGQLTLLRYSRSGGPQVGVFWYAQCDCGKTREVLAREVKRGRITSCGNCQHSYGIKSTKGRPAKLDKIIWKRYNKDALTRGIPFELSWTQFTDMIKQPCSYCGVEPSQRVRESRTPYSGLDLLFQETGYSLENTVPCCASCSNMKRKSNYMDFLEQVMKIAQFITNKKNGK